MTVFSGPFDSANMSQAQWEEVESKLWTNGVIKGARNEFVTTTTTGLGISVNTGDAVVDGFRFYCDVPQAITASAADPSLDRIDLVALRIDESAHTATVALKPGTPAASPVAPTATQTVGGTYELGIYQARVNAGSSTITSLTDVRAYTQPTLKGNTIGNGSGQIPVSNGVLNTNLNADTVDGKDAVAFLQLNVGGTVAGATNFSGGLTSNGSPVWTSGNDGAGSGLDADTLDGLSSAAFVQVGSGNELTPTVKIIVTDVLPAASEKRLIVKVPTTLP